jgi:bacterioferritin
MADGQGIQGIQGIQGVQGNQGGPLTQGVTGSEEVFQSFAPYPEIRVEGPNPYFAEIIMDDFAGVISEFTSVNQYRYHASDFVNLDPYLINMWTKIADVEMWHMRVLSRLIVLLGGRPVYRGSASTNGDYWYGGFVKYGYGICDQLQKDLETELQAIANYRQHILMISDGYVQQVLERIIRDEEVHVKNFEAAINRYCK